jgi:hypothetical protein
MYKDNYYALNVLDSKGTFLGPHAIRLALQNIVDRAGLD